MLKILEALRVLRLRTMAMGGLLFCGGVIGYGFRLRCQSGGISFQGCCDGLCYLCATLLWTVREEGVVTSSPIGRDKCALFSDEHFGAALQYGIDKDFSDGSSEACHIYDMGASTTYAYATLVYFSAYNAKEFGKIVSVNQFQLKDVRWDPELGGQNMELSWPLAVAKSRKSAILGGQRVVGAIRRLISHGGLDGTKSVDATNQICRHRTRSPDLSPSSTKLETSQPNELDLSSIVVHSCHPLSPGRRHPPSLF
ncbi:hypothetical protein LWI29_024670 [Acer saccharum]|uniref:Uncharacterized protein n=1 Tax=Acer saccharum TaxID=4024 RepID=A0AA39VJC1_ACESA|nr:hypothetical protein LWI29_024670 [Acer saccharum]